MYSRNSQFINWKTFDAAFLHLPYQCVACLSAQLEKFHSCRHTLLSKCMLVWVCVCAARKTSNYFRMQISVFSADFFLLPATRQQHRPPSNIAVSSPSSSLPPPSSQSDFFVSTPKWQHWLPDRQTSQRASDNRHGIWSAANLSQWYADKTNKYQVSLFLFPFRRSVFTLPAALPMMERGNRVRRRGSGRVEGKKTTLANKFI